MPWFGGGDNGFGIGLPGERAGGLVVVLDEAVDRFLEGDQRREGAAFEPAPGESGEEAFDRVQPRTRGRRKVKHPARVPGQPLADVRVLVRGVVVEDHVDHLAGRRLPLDRVQEAEQFLVPVTLHAAPDHRAVEHVECGKERGRAVALVVVGHGPGAARFHWQPGLGAIEGLDLRLLVEREDDGMARRVNIEADDVLELLGKGRVSRQLEAAHPMRSQTRLLPDLVHLGRRDPARLGHRAHRPVGGLAKRRRVQGPADHLGDLGRVQRRDARRPGLVAQQPVDAGLEIARLPAPDRRLGQPGAAHDLGSAVPVRGQQHHLSPPDVLLRTVPIDDDRCQTRTIRRSHEQAEIPSHPSTMAQPQCKGNLLLWTYH
jgi:hypothetical protein